MGVNFSHCSAGWSYIAFNQFRARLVKVIGGYPPLVQLYNENNVEVLSDELIYPLINHSDYEGNLTPEEMTKIILQLEDIIELWDDKDYDKIQAQELIRGMKVAIERNECLEFH